MKSCTVCPPVFCRWLFARWIPETEQGNFFFALDDVFLDKVQRHGLAKARRWYWRQLWLSVPGFTKKWIRGGNGMFKNHLKIAFRHLSRGRGYAAINIGGLAVGLAAVIFILLYLRFELQFDRHHANASRLYRVEKMMQGDEGWSVSMPAPLGPAMSAEFPEVEAAVRMSTSRSGVHVSANDRNFFESGFVFADSTILKTFTIPLRQGDTRTALFDPFSLLLSESMARKYFGDEDPLGKTVTYRGSRDFKVTGVMKDSPQTSSLVMHFVAPFHVLPQLDAFYRLDNWGAFSYQTYLLLRPDADLQALNARLKGLFGRHFSSDLVAQVALRFQPLTRIHIDARRSAILLFSGIAALILIIACMNYINLTTARSVGRFKEIGLRKVVGAGRLQLVGQFLGESLTLTLLALALAFCLVGALLPWFNRFIGVSLPFSLLIQGGFILWMVALALVVGLLAGGYPALAISGTRPVATLRGEVLGRKRSALRQALVVFQFMVTVLLLAMTGLIHGQMRFVQTRDLGYRHSNIAVVDARDSRIRANQDLIREALLKNPRIDHVSFALFLPNLTDCATTVDWPGHPESDETLVYLNLVDYDYAGLFGLQLLDGRDFSRAHATDAEGAFLLNETAVRRLGWDEPLGRELTHHMGNGKGRVVGVVKDFHMNSLHDPIEPLVIHLAPQRSRDFLCIGLSTALDAQTTTFIQETLAHFAPDYPFVMRPFQDFIDEAYASEVRLEKIFRLFSVLALAIAGLGLLGLTAFTVQRRTKEIGIRKVLGASILAVVVQLSRQMGKSVLLASVLAWPLIYWTAPRWLANFAYRISVGPFFYLLPALLTLAVAALTVSVQALRAARANPAQSLRTE